MKTNKVNMEREIITLIKTKPFYAHFIQTMNRTVTERVPTIGVNITDKINLFINPIFWNSITPQERVACLEHEVLHIINKHCIRGKKLSQQMIFNIACDIAINPYIKETTNQENKLICRLPKGVKFPKQFGFDDGETAEVYYKKLLKNAKRINIGSGEGKGEGKDKGKYKTLDDHSIWKEGNPNEDYQHQVIKNAIKKTLENTKDYGHLPASILTEIKKALRHETLNWRILLHRFLYRATKIYTVPTRKRPNRRYGIYFDGSKVECKLNMLVAIDTSGSISNRDLALFFSEIEKIKALGHDITIIECDCRIQKVYKYRQIPKIVSGRGGTDFKPVFDFARKQKPKPDCIIYLTDLYADLDFKNESRIPTLWAITIEGGDEKKVPFGIGIKLKDEKE